MKQKAITAALAVIFLALILSPSLRPVYAKDLRIGVPGKTLVFLPLFLAAAKGYFQSEGFTPQIIIMQSSIAMNALVSGELDYSTAFGTGVRAAVSGLPVRGSAVYMKATPFFLMAQADIRDVSGLKGQKIGITSFGSATHATVRAILKHNNMDPDRDVTILAMGTEPTYFAALQKGAIQAALLTPPSEARARIAGYRELAFSGDVLPQPASGLTTSSAKLRDKADEARRVLGATLKSIRFIVEQKQETIDLIARDWKVEPKVAEASYASILRVLATNGTPDPGGVESMIKDAQELIKSTRDVRVGDVVDFSLIQSVVKTAR
jgi:ABC-type nitrate/sulfonate/bicarbonate transport system substrate-binding protein